MTTTMHRTDSPTRTTTSADLLRVLMHEALSVAADDTADSFDSRTAPGRTLLSLAELARQAAGALGGESGVPVTAGPGVVVVRDFAAAVRLLDRAGSFGDVDGILATAKGLHAHLHETIARTGR